MRADPKRFTVQTKPWHVLFLLAWCILLGGVLALVIALWLYPTGSRLHSEITLAYLLPRALAMVLLTSPAAYLGLRSLRQPQHREIQVEVLTPGLEPGDYQLVQDLFPHSQEVRLQPITGGYSGAAVLQAQSWAASGNLQRSSVVKIGSMAKLQPEVENYERYVREYVGNTATLLQQAQRGRRMALRWAYAALAGDRVQTLADYATTGASLAPIIDQLFSSHSTLGLLLGTPRHEPNFRLYCEFSWPPNDWQRILRAAEELLGHSPLRPYLPFGNPSLPNPLPIVARWYDPETSAGSRANHTVDAPMTTIHGDLNSRNILVDEKGAIFVIDFAQTRPGHLLWDFARLETEIAIVLNQPTSESEIPARLHQLRSMLYTVDERPVTTLREILQPRAAEDRWFQAIVAVRRQAHDYAGPWLNGPAKSYLAALLHTTLDTLRYGQCSPLARRLAILIAAHLCQMLE